MSQTHVSTATRRTPLIVAAALVAIAAFGYRFTSFNGLTNDHFVHLARAQAMLAGDLPIRDYTEEGVPLTVLLSAGAQVLFGQSLFSEMVLVLTSLSVAAGATCWLTSRLTSSLTLGVGAAVLHVLIYPRLYSHPKLLLYSIFLLIVWWYLQGPGRRGTLVLALWTALSFLIRHDHGVYIGLSAGVVILVAYWREGLARVTREGLAYGILTLLCVAPYLVYVQYQQGIIDYFRTASRPAAARRRERGSVACHSTRSPLEHGWHSHLPTRPVFQVFESAGRPTSTIGGDRLSSKS
jgi:hypothetical protein